MRVTDDRPELLADHVDLVVALSHQLTDLLGHAGVQAGREIHLLLLTRLFQPATWLLSFLLQQLLFVRCGELRGGCGQGRCVHVMVQMGLHGGQLNVIPVGTQHTFRGDVA